MELTRLMTLTPTMAKTRMFVSVSLFLVVMTLTMVGFHVFAEAETRTPAAIFIFGDSTVDIGTNNFIPESGARANMPHNGVDYHGSPPTGRFSNGYNTADSIGEKLYLSIYAPMHSTLIVNLVIIFITFLHLCKA